MVIDATTGQNGLIQAKQFADTADITGIVLTKLDGDTRGGACLSIKAVTGKPIKFSSVGEKPEDLEPFYPDRMANRILGMGDVLSLIEKAQESVSEEQMKKMEKKFKENSFTLDDYLEQFAMLKNMGGAKGLMEMLPQMGGNMSKVKISEKDVDEKRIERTKAIILSMTAKERRDPQILNYSRKTRIAKGSGTTIQEINQLLKQFEQSKQMMKMMKGKRGNRMGFPF